MKDNQFTNEMRIPSALNEYQQLTAYSALRFAALRVSFYLIFINLSSMIFSSFFGLIKLRKSDKLLMIYY